MRIVIDFQAAQTGSRFRGIGHYATDFVKALISEGTGHEFYLVLNGFFSETIEEIRAEFDSLLPQEQIRVWYAPGPIEGYDSAVGSIRETAQIIREYFLRSLEPDVVLITSLFEGLGDDAVLTAKEYAKDLPTAAIFYDFTPLILPDEHFSKSVMHRRWYRQRIEQLRRCDLLLAISESSGREAVEQIGYPAHQIVTILGGINEAYQQREISNSMRREVLRRYGITKPFMLYTGGIEKNKNLSALIEALSHLPPQLKRDHELVIVGKRYPGQIEKIQAMASDDEALGMLKIVGFVPQSDLVTLYNLTELFVFPSLREGLGLPPAEAMACGAPAIVADSTSLPEVVDNAAALFDAGSAKSIAAKISEVLCNEEFRLGLAERGLARAAELTWEASAKKALTALEERFGRRTTFDATRRTVVSHTGQFKPKPLRILAMKLDHNGDFLLALPAMSKLRARYPDASIDVVVGSWNREAAVSSRLFDRVYTLDFYRGQSAVPPHLDNDALEMLLDEMPFYDLAIDLRRQHDTRFILTRFKADKYFGYKCHNESIDRLLTNPLDIHSDDGGIRSSFDETHTCEQMLRIIDALPFGIRDYVRLPDLGERLPVKEGSIAIFPRVGLDARQWDSSHFTSLINSLARSDEVTEINIYAGRADELSIIDFAPSPKIRIQTGLGFSELFSSLSANQVCVGNNSFGVHLAGYAGCRTIGIYSGHELPQQWGPPFGDSVAITVDAACAPCHLPDRKSCPHDLFCLNDISVDTVKNAVLSALAGHELREDYSRISRNNPATVIKPLVDAVNKSKFEGKIDGLGPDQRVAFAAALAINFPERGSTQRCIYLDVSGLLDGGVISRSNRRMKQIRETIDSVRDGCVGTLITIASGQHDHEFYAVDLAGLQESLHSASRFERIIRPLAGDVYVGLHAYLNRNPAQWNLLTTWRDMGVRTIFAAPDDLDVGALNQDDDDSRAVACYLFTIAHFDAILAPGGKCADLSAWIADFGPARLRGVSCSNDLLDLVKPEGRSGASGTRLIIRQTAGREGDAPGPSEKGALVTFKRSNA